MDKNKDLPELVSEMLIKQDRTNEILEEFMSVPVKQWNQQAKFNELFLEKFEKAIDKLTSLEDRVKHLENLEERIARLENLLRAS